MRSDPDELFPESLADQLAAMLIARDQARLDYERVHNDATSSHEAVHEALDTYCNAMDAYHFAFDSARRARVAARRAGSPLSTQPPA